MLHSFKPRRVKPNGLTLIELLVVVFIMMIFVAAAAPLVNPATSDRKVREASRQLNAFFAEAKAHAAQRGRPVGVAFDRVFAKNEGTRDPNIISRLYLVEVPPLYTGDTLSSTVQYRVDGTQATQNEDGRPFCPAAISVSGILRRPVKLLLDVQLSPMLLAIFQSYLPPGQTTGLAPFSIRLGGKGAYRAGYVKLDINNATTPARYYAWVEYGDPMYAYCSQAVTNAGVTTYEARTFPVAGSIPAPRSSGGMPPVFFYEEGFQIGLPPIVAGDSHLELPTGTVVDLQFSGYGTTGTDFFDRTRLTSIPLAVFFTPGGSVELVQSTDPTNGAYLFANPAGRLNFLVGTRKKDAESRDFTKDAAGFESTRNFLTSNLNDTASLWVSVNPRTGLITTSENAAPTPSDAAATSVQTAVGYARRTATNLNTKGGR
jgi:type II secretory pathway pseudopilin PulG